MNPYFDVSVKEFGAVGDGVADDTAAIQRALDSGARRVTIPDGKFLISNILEPCENQHLVVNGTIRLSDSPCTHITSDVKIGATQVTVKDASGFQPQQWVTLHDDRLPIQGGGRKTRRQSAGSARILSISGHTLHLDRASARSYLCEANALVGRQHSAIWIRHSGVRISGSGTIDGNKSQHLNTAPGFLEMEHGEDWRAASGILAMGDGVLKNITIEDVTVCDVTLMGIMLVNTEQSVIRNTTCRGAHDKNIILWCCRDCQIVGNQCTDSEFEDGIMLHQVHNLADACERILIQGNICKNNARFGIHIGANMQQIHLANNLCVENGLNLSIYGDNCTSTGDIASGTTDRLFTPDVYRPNVLLAGHFISVVNLTATRTRFVGLEIAGHHISVTGGIIGEMASPSPDVGKEGLCVEKGEWGAGSGEFYVQGDCRIGMALIPDFCGGRAQIFPKNVRVSGMTIHGCRVGVKACNESKDISIDGIISINNQISTQVEDLASQEVRLTNWISQI